MIAPEDARFLARAFGRLLDVELTVCLATRPTRVTALSPWERDRYRHLATAARRASWLRGRSALKMLLRRLGEPDDTGTLSFPNRRCSLTHSGPYALAVGTSPGMLRGLGVDLEVNGPPHPAAARMFLTRREMATLRRIPGPARPGELLRLWTAKEAVFKCDPDNHGRILADYEINAPRDWVGSARRAGNVRGAEFLYACLRTRGGFFSLAIMPGKESRT